MNCCPNVILHGTFYFTSCHARHSQENETTGPYRTTHNSFLAKDKERLFRLKSSPPPETFGMKRERMFAYQSKDGAGDPDSNDGFHGLGYTSPPRSKNYVHIYDDDDDDDEARRNGYGHRRVDFRTMSGPRHEREDTIDEQLYRYSTSHSPQSSPTMPATEADAVRAGIPAGYSVKHWDPMELPVILLGSVFDANSLGKWIYDWTVVHFGASTPMADMAGELWLLLIKLAGKMKKAEECVGRIPTLMGLEDVESFLEGGHVLWNKFKNLIRVCERPMLKSIKRHGAGKMGKDGAMEFVNTLFGRDRLLESTERIMSQIRLWTNRFDMNCEETIKHQRGANNLRPGGKHFYTAAFEVGKMKAR